MTELEDKFDLLVDTNDVILERVVSISPYSLLFFFSFFDYFVEEFNRANLTTYDREQDLSCSAEVQLCSFFTLLLR